jgi:hypothetical protein
MIDASATPSLLENRSQHNGRPPRDLDVARRHLLEVAALALRAALSPDPRVVADALAVLDRRRAA